MSVQGKPSVAVKLLPPKTPFKTYEPWRLFTGTRSVGKQACSTLGRGTVTLRSICYLTITAEKPAQFHFLQLSAPGFRAFTSSATDLSNSRKHPLTAIAYPVTGPEYRLLQNIILCFRRRNILSRFDNCSDGFKEVICLCNLNFMVP